jgi:hypothetical protein
VTLVRAASAVTALALLAAAPAAKVVPYPAGGPPMIIPADSPVKFTGFNKDGVAEFSGRFVLTGTFVYDCPADCEPSMTEDDVELHIIPDPAVAARLPHWQDRGDGMVVDITGYDRVKRTIASKAAVADLLSGKIPDVRGRASIVVDHYAADFGCDYSPYYAARFVGFAKPLKLARSNVEGNSGCI